MADLLRSHVEVKTYCDGGQHVVHVIGTYEMRVHLIDIGLTVDMPAEGKEGLTHADLTLHLSVAVSAIADDALQLTLLRHVDEMLVAGVKEDKSVVDFEEVIELTLGLHYAFKGSKALKVSAADVGDQSACRLNIVNQSFDVAGMRSTHLHHSDLVVGGEPQQCLGHTDVVVVVGLGVHHAVFLSEHSRDEFFGRGLAVGAGDADNRNGELAAVLACQFLVRGETIVDKNKAVIAFFGVFLLINNGITASFLKCALGEFVSVAMKMLSLGQSRLSVVTCGCCR